MKRLSLHQFERARRFLKTEARQIDRALFEHRFEAAPPDRVTDALASYHNADGGFGHALEPDVQTPSSSALATGIALGILRELDRPARDPMVGGAVAYLVETFDEETEVWRAIPWDANDYPHAPWWQDEEGSLARAFDDFVVIPRAQLVGLLHHYAELVPEAWLDTVTEKTVSAIESLDEDAFGGGGDTLRYALELVETEALPQRFKHRLLPRLRDLTARIVSREPDEWADYCATPLKVAPSPAGAVAGLLKDDLQLNLDYVIDHQTDEGTWEPTWTWGPTYPEAWEEAKHEWRGRLTLETLNSLRAFRRIDTEGTPGTRWPSTDAASRTGKDHVEQE